MATLFKSLSGRIPDYYDQKAKAEAKLGRKLSNKEFESDYLVLPDNESSVSNTGTSTFDPALCELLYLWFSAPGDLTIDPFAGGSVRGIVASKLRRQYTGVDIRQEQIDANYANAADLCDSFNPIWHCGDSMNIQTIAPGNYDFILTCPPYGDLEVYSDDPADISNMSEQDFDATYTEIMQRTVGLLREDRFAAVVVGNYRDGRGFLRDLCGLTIRAMENAGARYYNEMIFVQTAGSLPIRCGKSFKTSRKIGKMHQNVLIFCKGNPRNAAARLGDVQIPDMEQFLQEGLEQEPTFP